MKKYAVIVAGGTGTRMGSAVPKQFMLLNGKPVLLHTVEAFLRAYNDLQIILVLPVSFEEQGRQLILQSVAPLRIQMVTGGDTRFHSVQNGLKKINEASVVFVHDGVRCLVTEGLIRRCYEQTLIKGNAIPAVAVNDSIRIVEGDKTRVVDRSRLLAVQTPQTFRSEIILPAFEQPYKKAFTDEATVAEAAGYEVFMIEGEKENIKITLPADLLIAEQLSRKA
ncbi:2-C-methyl-D-erythritol 4-phosphate cytidylyltransferase [Agriterribacter sp.]|uniref:2-C-methyl-D-erythritol 4-phosphate cytidylyltransferase n=1 Tax=Agriterribacter sp. TaxID=2821509 RepID=UPI002D113579|nr:2-C-methyl-D-erythritol 4-phosphate cytidylyltransferase [Agriterribacter sp.]HRP55338.1 2-C-methyl-D-erythritol 4-phosphate cytidylyltransferase [Agriterribacter sp.]